MKRLNETQKKWALTASLATVLSFNLIMGLTGTTYSSASFASAKIDEEAGEILIEGELAEPRFAPLVTEDGKLKVKYVKEEDGTTKAYVPKIVEGKYCWEKCGQKLLLPTNFDASKEDLEQALRKAMKQEAKAELLSNDESDSDDVEEVVAKKAKKLKKELRKQREEDEEEIAEDKDLIALEKKCDPKDEEDDSRLQCFATGMTKLLKDKKGDHAKELVLALYKKEIEPGLIDSLSDSRDSDRRENGQVILEEMLSSVAKKYNYIRERMVKLSALAVIKTQQDAQKRLRDADTMKNTNPSRALQLQQDGYRRRALAENMAMNLDATLQSGLESAQFSRLISENQIVDLYTTNYADVVQPIIQGMRQNPLTYVIQGAALSDSGLMLDNNGNLVSVDPSLGAIGQLRSAGRGITVMGNGLTSANVITAGAPRIVTLNGMNNAQGTATIQVIQANQVPQAQYAPVAAPGTNVIGIRGR